METTFENGKMVHTFNKNIQVVLDFKNLQVDEMENGVLIRRIDVRGDFSLEDYNTLIKQISERVTA